MNSERPLPLQQGFRRRFSGLEKRDWVVTAVAVAIFALFMSKSLESSLLGNLQLLAVSMATIGIVAAGQTLVIITGGIDLSVGSMVGLTGMITAYLATRGIEPLGAFNPLIAAMIGLLAATWLGWLNGMLISRYKLAPFIVTFGMMNLLHGAAGLLSNGTPINIRGGAFDWMWAKVFGVVPVPAILLMLVFVITAYLLRNSRYGRYAYAIGSNETVAHLSGVNVQRTRQIIYAASGFLAGVSGLLLLALIRGGAYQNGQYYELFSIAAVIMGGTSLRGGSGSVWGTLAGVLLISMVRNGLILFSVPPLWNEIIVGAIIIATALIDTQRRRLTDSLMSVPSSASAVSKTAVPVIGPLKSLEQTIQRLQQVFEERFETTVLTVYLLDRETRCLSKPGGEAVDPASLAVQVVGSGKPCAQANLNARPDALPTSRAAGAVPLRSHQQTVGVIEFQSANPAASTPAELEAMMRLTDSFAAALEDYWLLETGWLTRHVRECLRNLTNPAYLEKSPLGAWLFASSGNQGAALYHALSDAIDHLNAEHLDANSRALRRYQILRQTYIDQKPVETIIADLALSRRQYFYDLKEGIDAVTHDVFTQHQGGT